jgi:poly(3-hydroxyalkanoate) synthetase
MNFAWSTLNHSHLFLVKKNIPRYYIYHRIRNRSFVKNLGHRDFRVFSTRRTPAWRNALHHLKLLSFIYKMMNKTPTFAELQKY